MSEQPGRYQGSFAGMIGALLVLLFGIGALVVLRDVNRVDAGTPVQAVDYAQAAEFAQEAARFPLLKPRRLPAGSTATSVRFHDDPDAQSWHVGVLTVDERYIGLEQAERPATALVEDFVDEDATDAGSVEIDGKSWARWTDPARDPDADPSVASEGDLALVRESGGATALVVGTVSEDELTAFAELLR